MNPSLFLIDFGSERSKVMSHSSKVTESKIIIKTPRSLFGPSAYIVTTLLTKHCPESVGMQWSLTLCLVYFIVCYRHVTAGLTNAGADNVDVMKLFARHSIRRYVAVSIISIICTLVMIKMHTESDDSDDESVDELRRRPPQPSTASADVTDRTRDWRWPNHVVLEYNTDVAQRLKKLSEHRTPGNHPDTVRLARDLLDPPPDNPDGIKHARYIMKTPQAEKVDEITQKMVM